jgi:hypothetical protein
MVFTRFATTRRSAPEVSVSRVGGNFSHLPGQFGGGGMRTLFTLLP